jgi:hypothetical protein
MDLKKLKIENFQNIKLVNFPENVKLNIEPTGKDVEVIIYFINKQTDIQKFVELCNSCDLPSDNRTIMVYRKGQKDGPNRDSIIVPFKNKVYSGFKLKAPMLSSLSAEFSAFVMSKIK